MIIVFLVFLIYYIAYQKQILKCISDAIGMKNVNVINESSAITIYYGYSRYKDMFVIEKNKSIN